MNGNNSTDIYQKCRDTYYIADGNDDSSNNKSSGGCPIKFKELREINDDIIGWITINGTNINYPILQGSDNTHYLNYAYDNSESWKGSIFLDSQNQKDFSDLNSVIYGHCLTETQDMFTGLNEYVSEEYWKDHSFYSIWTADGIEHIYRIYSVYTTTSNAKDLVIQANYKEYTKMLETAIKKSLYSTGTNSTANNKTVTLVTSSIKDPEKWIVIHAIESGVGMDFTPIQ